MAALRPRETEAGRFARTLLAALPPTLVEPAPRRLELDLETAFAAAELAWPAVRVGALELVEYLAQRVSTLAELETAIRPELFSDLWLACACTRGDREAITQLEARCFPIVAAALTRMRLQPHEVDELLQQLRAHLFAPRREAEMGIASFRGRGALVAWVKVIAVRLACQRRSPGEAAAGDEALERLSSAGPDAESAYARSWSRAAFKQAFAAALAALPARDKALLRLHYVDGVSLDQLGGLYRTHRATAARWLAAAKQRLLDGTRAQLVGAHRIPLAECDSIIRSAQSQLELTLHRLFAPAA